MGSEANLLFETLKALNRSVQIT